jgi:hypothetical protein
MAVTGVGVGLLLYLPSALDGGGWLTSRPKRFVTREDSRYVLQKAGWLSGTVWAGVEGRKSDAGPGFRTRAVQPVTSHYKKI